MHWENWNSISDGPDSEVIFECGVRSGAHGQERILEMSLLQNGGFSKAPGQNPCAEIAAANLEFS